MKKSQYEPTQNIQKKILLKINKKENMYIISTISSDPSHFYNNISSRTSYTLFFESLVSE